MTTPTSGAGDFLSFTTFLVPDTEDLELMEGSYSGRSASGNLLAGIPQRKFHHRSRFGSCGIPTKHHSLSFVPCTGPLGKICVMTQNIILIGFMGCGKSSIGRRLAGRLGYELRDSDDLITARAGKSITDIFNDEGEARFRERETMELRELIDSQGIVLATGGGAVLREENREILRRIGLVVWLHSDPETLFERANRNRKRPLLDVENPRGTFNALLESRLQVYEAAADRKVDATGLSHDQTVEALLSAIGAQA
jgi:shikimate kinase